MKPRPGRIVLLAVGIILASGGELPAADISVVAEAGRLASAIDQAEAGDRLVLETGVHAGGVTIRKSLRIEGRPGAIIDAGGAGTGIKILAADVTVRGLAVRNSGTLGENFDSGIYLEQGADRATIEGNSVEENLFGIVLHGTNDVKVRNNTIRNRNDLWLNDRGNGIHVWNNRGTVIEGNRITSGRDGIYIELSDRNVLRKNHFEGLRFAIHYMSANDNEITDNVSIRNRVGFALMYSKKLKVYRNLSVSDLSYGLMLHSTFKSDVAHNSVYGTGEKGLFVYTSAGNSIHDNRFEQCGVGIHFTGGSENNKVFGNSFLANEFQVKYTGLRTYEWSQDGRGNYWSDNPAFDLNGDGIADRAYRPNTLVDWILWRYPLAKMLVASPAMQTLRFVQEQLPTLYPGGAIDSFPLMIPQPPPVTIPAQIDLTPAPRDPAQAGNDSRPIM